MSRFKSYLNDMNRIEKILTLYTEEKLRDIIRQSHCKSSVADKLGIPKNGTGGRIVNELLAHLQCDISHFDLSLKLRKHVRVEKTCPVCGNHFFALQGHSREKATCSYACSNTFFRSGKNNGQRAKRVAKLRAGTSWQTYTEICWQHHEKSCVVCGEFRVVAVHHYNGHHWDNKPSNLVPLCPTHHLYWHSRYQHLIKDQVDEYVNRFVEELRELDDSIAD